MRVLVTSTQDIASQTIKQSLIEEHGFRETDKSFEGHPIYARDDSTILITSEHDLIDCGHLEGTFDAEVFIFCSRHKAASGRPALLVHSTGNLGAEAEYGGSPHSLSVSTASLVSRALRSLFREREKRDLSEFDVTMEVTHHGPTRMNTPLVFVELGSNEEYWRHEEGGRAVAAAIMDCVREPFQADAMIGFGGSHYASKFNKVVLEEKYRLGHMAPKYMLNDIPVSVIEQMIMRSREKVKGALIDWKGTNATQRQNVLPVLEEQGIEIIRMG
ncbi:MAG: hypothetical protein K9W43_03135 [Candidatus Thorarchaeota archaeon]|nr:hypothetical protein [Candidatus Thorarchaeota archaeon]